MEFYKEELENDRKLKEDEHFKLIHNLSVELTLHSLTTKPTTPETHKLFLHVLFRRFEMRFNPFIYKQFFLLPSCFSLSKDDQAWSQLMAQKNHILACSKKIGILKKRGARVKTWQQYFCVLSGGYLYFYATKNQEYSSFYYYIQDAVVNYAFQKLAIQNTVIVSFF
jgi:hypothetical protein